MNQTCPTLVMCNTGSHLDRPSARCSKPGARPKLALTLLAATILWLPAGCAPGSSERMESPAVDSVSALILEEALAALGRADFSTAMGFAEGVEARQPGLVETRYVKGRIYYELRLYEEAEQHWSQVLEAEPDYWLWWQNMGDVAFHREQFRRSAEHYGRAASLDSNPLTWHGLAGAYWEMGLADSAAYALQRAVESDSMHAPVYLSLSNLAEEAGDLDEAYAFARRAMSIDSTSTDYHLAAGILAYKLGAFDEAAALLSRVLEDEPWNYTALYNLGQALQRTGRRDEGQRYLDASMEARGVEATLKLRQDAVQNNPKNPSNHVALADALHRAGRVDEALRAYKTADLMLPPDPRLRHTIATLTLDTGDHADAVIRYYDVIQRDSTFVEAWLNLGVAYARMNEMEQARDVWNEAARRFPNHPGVAQVLERASQ